MSKRNSRLLVSLCAALPLLAMCSARSDAPATQPAAQSNWPQKTVVTVGEIRTRIEGSKMWTLSGIDYQDTMMATEDSAYGTVLTIRNVGHLGTAHFLDVPGKPGEVEKEAVNSLQFYSDDQPVTQVAESIKLHARTSFRMERSSHIRTLELRTTISVRDGLLAETVRFHAEHEMDLQKAHPMMYAWTPGATKYLYGNEQGIQQRGTFQKEGKTDFQTIRDSRWMACFNPNSGKGSVCYLTKHPADADGWFLLVDAPGVYRKLAVMTFVDKVMPEGFTGTFQAVTGFFSASEQDWEQVALRRARDLAAANFPVPDEKSSAPR